MNVNLTSNIIQVEVYWRLLSPSLLRCISDWHAVDLPHRFFFSFSSSLYFNCCRINVTASCRASQALVSWIGSQRGGGGTMSQLPRASSDSCCAPPCSESGLTGLRGHLHWMGCNAENVGSGSHSVVSSRGVFRSDLSIAYINAHVRKYLKSRRGSLITVGGWADGWTERWIDDYQSKGGTGLTRYKGGLTSSCCILMLNVKSKTLSSDHKGVDVGVIYLIWLRPAPSSSQAQLLIAPSAVESMYQDVKDGIGLGPRRVITSLPSLCRKDTEDG